MAALSPTENIPTKVYERAYVLAWPMMRGVIGPDPSFVTAKPIAIDVKRAVTPKAMIGDIGGV